jgi:metal-responsive CopG/Arc/MetJ family transcriptional regulator
MAKDPLDMDSPVARTTGTRSKREMTLHIRVTEEMVKRLDEQARKEQRSRSDMLRVLIRRGWERS